MSTIIIGIWLQVASWKILRRLRRCWKLWAFTFTIYHRCTKFQNCFRFYLFQSWDKELAELAQLNVMKCTMKHDRCHKTERFNFSGQNIYKQTSTSSCFSVDEEIKGSVKAWFDEHHQSSSDDIPSYTKKPNRAIGHFTQVVKDDSNFVGCAMIQFERKNLCTTIVTCNYAKTNMIGEPVYVAGEAASKCEKKSEKFSALCSL